MQQEDTYRAAVAIFAAAITNNASRLRHQSLMKECILAARELEILVKTTILARDEQGNHKLVSPPK